MKTLNATLLSLVAAGASVLGLSRDASAATIAAASCSYSAVSAAVSAAAQGDTVTVPAGSCTWSSTLSIRKGISLVGAGIGSTVITKGTGTIIHYQPADASANALIRISGFTFDFAGSGGTGINVTSGNTLALQTKLRIDHNRFQNIALGSTQDHYIVFASMRGVVDSNQFGRVFYPFRAPTSPIPDGGKAIWNNHEGVVFGKADNNIVFEDNVFEQITDPGGTIVMDCQEGGRYAFRYNTINLSQSGQPMLDMHGNQGSSFYGCMGGELYGNKVVGGGGTFLDQRGGRVFVFNNSASQAMGFQIREEYDDSVSPVSYAGPNAPQYPQHVNGSYYWSNRVGTAGSLMTPHITRDCSQCYKNGLAAGGGLLHRDQLAWHQGRTSGESSRLVHAGPRLLGDHPVDDGPDRHGRCQPHEPDLRHAVSLHGQRHMGCRRLAAAVPAPAARHDCNGDNHAAIPDHGPIRLRFPKR